MKIPELRTGEMTLVVKHDSPLCMRPSHTVVDQDGHVRGIFFGPYAQALAGYCTTFTDILRLRTQAQAPVETVAENTTPQTPQGEAPVEAGRGIAE